MKKQSIAAMLAMAGMLLVPTLVVAQSPVSYTPGDLLMGFRAKSGTGSTKDYLVNIGQATQYTGATNAFVVAGMSGVSADLEATFGASWSVRSDVYWSVAGSPSNVIAVGADEAKTVYVTKAQDNPGTLNSVPWLRKSGTAQGGPSGKLVAMADAYARTNGTANLSTANNSAGIIQLKAATNSYYSYQPGGTTANSGTAPGISYAFFNPSAEASFAAGTAGAVLELYRVVPATGASVDTPAQLVGYFQLSGNTVAFTPAAQIAESTLSMAKSSFSAKESDGNATVTVLRGGGLANVASVTLTTSNGTGLAGTDYTSTTQVVNFAAGQTQAVVSIPVVNNPAAQGDKTFTVALSGAGSGAVLASGAPSAATVTIFDGATASLDSSTYTVAEDVAGGTVPVTVTLSGSAVVARTVKFTTSSGPANGVLTKAAVAGVDFTNATQTLSFAAGETTKVVNVAVANRSGAQGNRDFTVSLSDDTNALGLVTTSAVVTITEGVGTVSFASATTSALPTEINSLLATVPRTVQITLTRSGAAGGPLSVTVDKTVGGTLLSTEFSSFASTVTFLNGETTKTFSFPLTTKIPATATRTASFTLSGAVGVVSGQSTNALTVELKDSIKPVLKITSPAVGSVTDPAVTIAGTVKENVAGVSLTLTVNGVSKPLTVGAFAANADVVFNTGALQLENGINVIVVTAVDPTGNTTVLTKSVKLSNTTQFGGQAGVYTGLLKSPYTNANDKTGYLSATVTTAGLFTAKVTVGGEDIAVSGYFTNDGSAHFKPDLGTKASLVSPVGAPLFLGALDLQLVAGVLTGNLSTQAVGGSTLATLTAAKSAYSTTNPVPGSFLNVTTSTPNKGVYAVVFPSKVQANNAAASTYPQGDGVGTLTVLANGKVTLAGSLADGTPVVASGLLGADKSVALFSKLYSTHGCLAGITTLADATDSDVQASTSFLWIKPALKRSQYYPLGWESGILVDMVGTKFTKPASLDFGQGAGNLVTGNASLLFSEGLLSASRTSPVNIDPVTGKVTVIASVPQPYTAALVTTTGLFTGTFTHSDSTKPIYKGVLLNKGANKGGFGYFLSTPTATYGGTGQSGAVNLNP